MTTRSRRVLLLGTHGQFNVGDELLLRTFLRQLGDEHRYQVNSYDPAATAEAIGDVHRVEVFDTAADTWRLPARILRSDVVVFAGGSIVKELTPATGRWRYSTMLMVLAIVTFARRVARRPVLFSNIGVGPVVTGFGRLLAKLTLRQADLVATRDAASAAMSARLGVPADRLAHVPDAVFANTAADLDHRPVTADRDPAPLRVALNLNHDVDDEEEWDRFLELVADALRALAAERDLEIVGLPMQSTFKDDNDMVVLRDFLDTTGLPGRVATVVDHADVARIVGDVDVVLSERLHAIVIAAIVGTPVVALPYSTKVTELADELGLHDRSFPVNRPFRPGELRDALAGAADDHGEGPRLEAHAERSRAELVAHFDAVRRWIDTPTRSWSALRSPATR